MGFPAGAVREPFTDLRDAAEVVVAALADGERYAGRALTVSGPRLLTFGEAVAEIAAATGRELSYRAVTAREYGANLAAFGVPEAARGFGDFVRETAATGAWKP